MSRRVSSSCLRVLSKLRNRHFVLWDIVTQGLCISFAFLIRLEEFFPISYGKSVLFYAILASLIKVAIYRAMGIYKRMWRYAGTDELVTLIFANFMGSAALTLLIYGVFSPLGLMARMPRSIPIIEFILSLCIAAFPRMLLRLVTARQASREKPLPRQGFSKVVIAGAGQAGITVLREINQNPQLGYVVVAMVDDDPQKQGLEIMGCRVRGTLADVARIVQETGANKMIIAMPSVGGDVVRHLRDACRNLKLEMLTMPGIYELIDGRVSVERLRNIQIEDLLRRDPVETDRESIRQLVAHRRVLVTGGGGSIGSELCRQIASYGPTSLIVLGHGENSLYDIQRELRLKWPWVTVDYVVADVRDECRLNHIFDLYRPEIVFHAAAHKHVPLMEDNIQDAVTNNVHGTRNLVEICARYDVPRFVMISTDKAVNPTSVMGVTKRIAEMVVQDVAQRTGKAYVAVRFGNVLGSRGSVVPLFQQQIAAGGPVTVTDARVQRYFMTIPEAVQLVLQAGVLGTGGEVFVLDMGQPIKIIDLARDMIELAGLEPDVDIEIKITGLRPGEKLFEELILDKETYVRSKCDKVYVLKQDICEDEELQKRVDELLDAARQKDGDRVRQLLHDLVPEFVEPCSDSFEDEQDLPLASKNGLSHPGLSSAPIQS